MANKQIPALPPLDEAPADDDRFVVRDTSSGSDKSLRVDRLDDRVNQRGFAQSVDSVSTLRTSTFPASLERLWLSGYYGVGTPGGGPLYRDDESTEDDDDEVVFVDADGVRWKRQKMSKIHVPGSEFAPALSIEDAIYSWWSNPAFIRHRDNAYLAYTTQTGEFVVAQYSYTSRTIKTRTLKSLGIAPDDHNNGAVMVGDNYLAVIFPGRNVDSGTGASFYWKNSSSNDIDNLGSEQTVATASNQTNYPNLYDFEENVVFFYRGASGDHTWRSRVSVRSGGEVLASADWQAERTFYQPTLTWPYFNSRRSKVDPARINLVVATHPVNEENGDIRYGQMVADSATPWDVVSNGTVVGNLTDGSGLPLTQNDFELVYQAADSERTRVFEVHDDCIVFASYTEGSPEEAVYKYARKVSGSWQITDIAQTGQAFYLTSNYFGGAALDDGDVNTVYISRQVQAVVPKDRDFQAEERKWLVEEYRTANNGGSFSLVRTYEETDEVAARPLSERVTPTSSELEGDRIRFTYWKGRYSLQSFRDFYTFTKGGLPGAQPSTPKRKELGIGETVTFIGEPEGGDSALVVPVDFPTRGDSMYRFEVSATIHGATSPGQITLEPNGAPISDTRIFRHTLKAEDTAVAGEPAASSDRFALINDVKDLANISGTVHVARLVGDNTMTLRAGGFSRGESPEYLNYQSWFRWRGGGTVNPDETWAWFGALRFSGGASSVKWYVSITRVY